MDMIHELELLNNEQFSSEAIETNKNHETNSHTDEDLLDAYSRAVIARSRSSARVT